MKKISLFIIFLIRVISGIVIFRQGWEKFTGDFTLNGLVPVIRDNTDSPQWYKWFFEHIVAHTTGLFNIIVPLGEMAIGLGLILGIFAYAASFFGAFVMINYILADMIFTYPLQLVGFILIVLNIRSLRKLSVAAIVKKFMKKEAG